MDMQNLSTMQGKKIKAKKCNLVNCNSSNFFGYKIAFSIISQPYYDFKRKISIKIN